MQQWQQTKSNQPKLTLFSVESKSSSSRLLLSPWSPCFISPPLVALVAWSYMAGDNKPAVATTTQRTCWSGWRSYLELISLPRWNDDFRPICRSANYIVNICIPYIYMYNMYIICYNIIYLYKICKINIHVCILWTFVYHIYIQLYHDGYRWM